MFIFCKCNAEKEWEIIDGMKSLSLIVKNVFLFLNDENYPAPNESCNSSPERFYPFNKMCQMFVWWPCLLLWLLVELRKLDILTISIVPIAFSSIFVGLLTRQISLWFFPSVTTQAKWLVSIIPYLFNFILMSYYLLIVIIQGHLYQLRCNSFQTHKRSERFLSWRLRTSQWYFLFSIILKM